MTQQIPLSHCRRKKLRAGKKVTVRVGAGPLAGQKRLVFTTKVNVGGIDEQDIEVQAERVRCFGNGSAEFRLRAVSQMAEAR